MEFFTNESFGVLTAGLLVVGLLKMIYYYKSFNVAILRYIDPSEIVILFADNIFIAGIILIALLPPYVYTILPYMQGDASANCEFQERIVMYAHILCVHFIYQVPFGIILIILTFFRNKIVFFERLVYCVLFFVILFVIPATTLEAGHIFKTQIKHNLILSIALVTNFLVLILAATYNEITKVKKHNYFGNTRVEFEVGFNASMPKDSYYIGKVKSFIFFYSPSNNESITYSTGKLQSITFKPAVNVNKSEWSFTEWSLKGTFKRLFQSKSSKPESRVNEET